MESIKRIVIFSLIQRLMHAAIALGVLFELISAWLIQHSDVDVIAWSDWHAMVGQVLLLVIILRVALLFKKDSTHWRLLIPTREQRHIVVQTLKFYASLGRLPCPDWYAINPVWQPVYLVLLLVLLFSALSGFLIGKLLLVFGIAMSEIHISLGLTVLYFTVAHTVFVILHDAKGNGAQISAMLNGYKFFMPKNPSQNTQVTEENSVSLDSLLKK